MVEPVQFKHPETEIAETRFVRGVIALAAAGGATLGLGTAAQELLTGSVDNTEAAARYLLSIAVEAAAVPTYLYARHRGRQAQQQLTSVS